MPFVEITDAEYNKLSEKAKLAYVVAQNAHLKAVAASMPAAFVGKVTPKYIEPNSTDSKGNVRKGGNVGLYGLGRMPVTLYKGQWLRALDSIIDVPATIKADKLVLSADMQAALDKCPEDTRDAAKNSPAAPVVQNAPVVSAAPVKANPLAGFSPEQLKALSPEQIVALSA